MSPDPRRTYYDHEPEYRRRSDQGFRGWSVSSGDGDYDRFNEFATSGRLPSPGVMLDTGCGGGELSIRLSELGWKTAGIDFAETALQLALQNARNADVSAGFARADLTGTWPFGENTFDLVLDNHVLHCLIDPAHRSAYFANAHRVLKRGGMLFSTNMSKQGDLDYRRYNIDPDTGIDANNTRIWVSQNRMLEELAEAGFTIRQCQRYGPPNSDDSGDELVIEATKG